MAFKIYVGGLPYSTSEAELQDLFTSHGNVESAKLITDKYTGQSRGFGFVEMANNEEGQKAVDSLDGHELQGRNLRVDVAKEREESGDTGNQA